MFCKAVKLKMKLSETLTHFHLPFPLYNKFYFVSFSLLFSSHYKDMMETKKTIFFLLLVSSPVAKLTKEDGGEYLFKENENLHEDKSGHIKL